MIPPNVRQRSFVELSLVTLSPADLAPFEVSSQESPELPSEGLRRLPRPGAARERILLVEDDRSIRVALQGILEDEGYAVTAADNGRQALERLRSGVAPDLIVLDLRMPVMDGWEFRAVQKSDPALARIPVLAVSADGSAKAAAIDAQAYLRKPLNTDALLNAIGRILGEADRQSLLRRLEEAERFAALGRLAASVGHEINNPLAYVSMNVDLAVSQLEEFVGRADRSAAVAGLANLPSLFRECRVGLDRIRDVVKDLQRLSRQAEVRRETFSLNDLLDESLAMARNQVEHRARVRKLYGEVHAVVGDRSAFGQVLLNLILNAAQAIPEGRAERNEITLRTYMQGGDVAVEIGDTGAGIPPHALPHIFDPFFTTKPIGEGTGLGLAVSCRIVADHGGRIDVESKVGRGSLFRVTLPIAQPPLRETSADGRSPGQGRVTRARILVIDDLPAFGRTISRALTEHEVTVVARANDAFALLAADETFDVVLCDLLMPETGGPGVFERLKADWPELARNVIFMTGGAFTPESRAFLEQTPQAVLTKPFSLEELRTAVRLLMEGCGDSSN
ncbi:MAG TPA: response regulator [Polyangia bacterium]|nr:response regulator [Polyangia bacterium]